MNIKQLILTALVIFPAFLVLNGCSDDAPVQNAAEKTKQIVQNPNLDDSVKEEKKPEYKEISITEFFGTPIEDIDNESSYDMPRIQFLFPPQKNQKPQFWSVKIDGTDLREVIPYKEFYAPERDATLISGKPKRSPNNRYIVMMRDRKSHAANIAMLYDLKTKQWEEVSNISGNLFSWLPDSSGFCLIQSGRAYIYDIASKAHTKTDKRLCGFAAEPRPNGTYLTRSFSGRYRNSIDFSILDSNFKEIDSFNIQTTEKFTNIGFEALDINGNIMLYQKYHNNRRKFPPHYFLYDINKKEVTKEIGQIYGDVLYMSSKQGFLFSSLGSVLKKYSIDYPTEETTLYKIRKSYESGSTTKVTIYNLGDLAYE